MKKTLHLPVVVLFSSLLFLGPRSAQALTAPGGPDVPAKAPAGADQRARATERLALAGLPADDAASRVAAMAPEEVSHVADTAPEVRNGGDAGSTVLLLIAVAAITYIVFDYIYYHRAPAY